MKLGHGEYANFCSYPHLSIHFDSLGLCVVTGPTGAGKSTVFDAPAWCLYGATSKDGAADDVRPWGVSEPTKGVQDVQLHDGFIVVTRIRGTPRQNDLFWTEIDGEVKRGKDINETQKMLEERLGCSAELYFTSAYLHQFSKADSFFIAKAKERRDTLERIADLSLPVLIAERAKESRKIASISASSTAAIRTRSEGTVDEVKRQIVSIKDSSDRWDREHEARLCSLRTRFAGFEEERLGRLTVLGEEMIRLEEEARKVPDIEAAKIRLARVERDLEQANKRLLPIQLDRGASSARAGILSKKIDKMERAGSVCADCGHKISENTKSKTLKELSREYTEANSAFASADKHLDELSKYIIELRGLFQTEQIAIDKATKLSIKLEVDFQSTHKEYERWDSIGNTYKDAIAGAKQEANPFAAQIIDADKRLAEAVKGLHSSSVQEKGHLSRVAELTQLYDLSMELRGKLLEKAVIEIQSETNRYLERYFEGEMRVEFALDADKLDVEIQKGGYACSFKQLSGGQRCMLKLAFSLSLMAASANKAGMDFGTIFLDEPLNGLDLDMKVRTFALFEELAERHISVLVVEHAEEFKTLFSRQYAVKLGAEGSALEEVAA